MPPHDHSVLVVGAGAAGLAATTALISAGHRTLCLEARDRVGGRLLGVPVDGGVLDLGATWCWDGESRVQALAHRLGLPTFPQHTNGRAVLQNSEGVRVLPDNPIDGPAHRHVAGTAALADHMAAGLPAGSLLLNAPVTKIQDTGAGLAVHTASTVHHVDHVVLAVPPALAVARIDFGDALPTDLARLARATPVWMGAVIKVVALYPEPFWRADGLAGAAFSHTGPLRELHDMSGPDGNPAALFGFAPATAARPGFRSAVRDQLGQLFGPAAARPTALYVQDWSAQTWTSPADASRHNDFSLFGHARYQQAALGGRLHWASTETAVEFAGHIEGALRAGERAAHSVHRSLRQVNPCPR
jgi:monoamine oxidase